MSTLSLSDFAEFFAVVHGGAAPFPWQQRLVARLVEQGRWPAQIAAPTGAGKTAVVDAHVFAVAAMADGWGARVPRRLALVVPRRVLVDSQFQHACHIATLLRDAPDPDSVLGRVAAALRSLRWSSAPETGPVPGAPLLLVRLRGGLPVPRGWRDDPVACGVLSATPDMWGSRLLLHGYGSAPRAWPREAGLVALDAVAVVDEAHLAQQLLVSARAVARLVDTPERPLGPPKRPLGPPSLQVVETTATPSSAASDAVGVGQDDLDTEVLKRRLQTPKPLRLLRSAHWPAVKGRARTLLTEELAAAALELRQRFGPTVGVFVNTVGLAVELAGALRTRTRTGTEHPLEVALVCGRLRDYDLTLLDERFPGLLSLDGNSEVDILVATQSLEVGVDLDLSAALTELAPAQSVAQRVGRVNRLGRREATEVIVVVPEDHSLLDERVRRSGTGVGPYDACDLRRAYIWLERRAKDPRGLAPGALVVDQPPTASPRRVAFQRVELADSWWWARTIDDLEPGVDLDLWLAEDLEDAPAEAGVVVRRAMPSNPADAIALLRAIPPREHEVFPAPIAEIRRLVEHLAKRPEPERLPAAVIVRAGEALDVGAAGPLRPGDVVVIDDEVACFTEHVLDADRVLAPGKEAGQGRERDVSERRKNPGPGEVVLRIDEAFWGEDAAAVLARCSAILTTASTKRKTHNDLAVVLASYEERSLMVGPAVRLLQGRVRDVDLVPFRDEGDEGDLRRLVVIDQRTAASDESVRQVWTTADHPPTLDEHANAVATRAAKLATALQLDEEFVRALCLAGLHHDDGKADTRFQVERLGWDGTEALLAKGRDASARARRPSTLPAGWRHEQLSAVKAALALDGRSELNGTDRRLVLRLVGTSHGRGRVSFPHSAVELFPHSAVELGPLVGSEIETARALYDQGEWDDIVQRTDRIYGVWGCAFLEAVLRAADGQVSGEGS